MSPWVCLDLGTSDPNTDKPTVGLNVWLDLFCMGQETPMQ